jgi:hypothetical protein
MLGLGRLRVAGLGALLALSLPSARAAAHGGPPAAYSVIVVDDDGPVLIKLGVGFALRESAERFRYVCPAAWGGELAAPAAALPDGTVVVGADDGLMLLAADGSVTPHPDANARGFSTELVRAGGRVFALRYAADRSEVVEVDAEQVRMVWSEARTWYSMAALGDALVLMRASGTELEQLRISLEGGELARHAATAPRPVDYVFARNLADEALALLLIQTTPELGRLQDGAFVRVALGGSSIAGPITTEQGALLAVDGQLQRLGTAGLVPLSDTTYVGCLERHGAEAYACTREGVSRIGEQGLGQSLFALTWLVPPDLTQLETAAARARCDYQWQDLRFDLISIGLAPRDQAPDAGTLPTDAGDGAEDGGSEPASDASEEPPPGRGSSSRCALGVVDRGGVWCGCALLASLLALRLRRRVARHEPA